MKTTFTLCVLALMILNPVSAQKPITISEDSLAYGSNKYPALLVSIPEVGFEKTEKNWIKELETGTKSKVVDENGEMTIFGAIIKDISPTPMNIYSKMGNEDSQVTLLVSFELKKDSYISKAAGDAELLAAREYLKEFAKNQYVSLVRDQLMAEEKKLRDLNSKLSKMQGNKSKMQKSIQRNRTLITEMKDNIVIQNNELTKVSAELVSQTDQLSSMEEGTAKEEKAKYVNDLEKRKKKILKDIETSENKITRANSDINDADREIPRNESEQGTLREKIGQQEMVVRTYNEKLNTVKAY